MSSNFSMPGASLIKPLVRALLEHKRRHDLRLEMAKLPHARAGLLGELVVAHHLRLEATKIPCANSGLLGA